MKKSLTLAIVVESISAVNGVSRTYQRLIEYCQKNNITADVYTVGLMKKTERHGSVMIYQFKPKIPCSYYPDLPPFDLSIFSPGVAKTFTQKKYDLVHLATPGSLGIAVQHIARKNHIPCVGVFHTQLHVYAERWAQHRLKYIPVLSQLARWIVWRFVRWFYNRCVLVLAPSRDTQTQLQRSLRKPIELFRRGVNTQLFNPTWRDETLRATKKPIALYVGRLSSEKNLKLLADVFQKRTDVELWIVGDGKERTMLEKKLPAAHFFGSLDGEALSRVYASADFFVFPSTTDTFGNVIMEAHASGLPTIVTTIGGPAQQVQNSVTGYSVEPTVKAFDQAITILINNPQKMQAMGMAARETVLTKSWDSAFAALCATYEKIV